MGLRWRLSIAIVVFLACLVYALPSLPGIGTALERFLPSSKINLGLDLKGGIHLTLGVDVAKAVSNSLALAGAVWPRMKRSWCCGPAWWAARLWNLCCRAPRMRTS